MLARRGAFPHEGLSRGIDHNAQREVGSRDQQGAAQDLTLWMRVGRGEEKMEDFPNTRLDFVKAITEGLQPISEGDEIVPHSSQWREGVWGSRWECGCRWDQLLAVVGAPNVRAVGRSIESAIHEKSRGFRDAS
jgi:hypothetical protein